MMTRLVLFATLLLGIAACGGGDGACSMDKAYQSLQECHNNWTQADCDKFNNSQTNSTTWTFHSGKSCADVGFSYRCDSTTYTPSAILCCGGSCG